MACRRCRGLMVLEEFCESIGAAVSRKSMFTRCVNCGNMEDAMIFINRLKARSIGTEMQLSSMKLANRRTMERARAGLHESPASSHYEGGS